MDLETVREKQLDAYLKSSSALDDQKLRIPLKGKPEQLQVYRIPIKYLIYNIRNGRFAAELLAKESGLKRKLDPGTREDAKIIQKLLLELNQTETDALKADLRENGQLDPGVITRDGAVINGTGARQFSLRCTTRLTMQSLNTSASPGCRKMLTRRTFGESRLVYSLPRSSGSTTAQSTNC